MIGWLVAGVAVLLGVPAAMYLAQDGLIFLPQLAAAPPDPAQSPRTVEPLEIETEDGVRLRGWLATGRTRPAPLVVYFGGNAENVGWQLLEPWPEDWSLALINYRGYGDSEGRPSERALVADAALVVSRLAKRPDVDAARVVLAGRSLGTGVATAVAAGGRVAGVILISPYDSLVALAGHHYPVLPARWLLKHPFESIEQAPAIDAPLLAVVAGRDAVIPVEHSRRLYEAWRGTKRWLEVPAADHNSLGPQPEVWSAIRAFLAAPGGG